MIYLNNFDTHTSYEEKLNVGGIGFKIPNVSYCKDVKDVHFNPYNLIKFYVGEVTEPQTVMISTDLITFENVQVSEGNKWYSYLLPKGKGLCAINGTVNKVVVKADIKTTNNTIIPSSTVEASFKGSNTSNLTSTTIMFSDCSGLTSLDLSKWDISEGTIITNMFEGCSNSLTIRMKGCSEDTINKVTSVKPSSASISTE